MAGVANSGDQTRAARSVKTCDRSQNRKAAFPSIEATPFGIQAALQAAKAVVGWPRPDFLPEAVSTRCKALVGLSGWQGSPRTRVFSHDPAATAAMRKQRTLTDRRGLRVKSTASHHSSLAI